MSCRLKPLPKLVFSLFLLLPGALHAESSFVDHRGKTITFAKPPERVVTIVRSAPIIYRSIDAKADNIAGMNKDSLVRYFAKGIYAEMLPEMAKIEASAAQDGFVPNVEAILAQKPDAVIQWAHDEKLIEPLERVGLTVVGWQCCTEQDRLDYLTLTGYMTGRNDRAQAILKAQTDTLKTLDGKVAKLDTSALPKVLHIDKVADQIQVIANGSQNLALSGVSNPAADNTGEWWRTVDFEQLLVWNPDIIVIPAYADDLNPKDFFDNPVLSSLKAVKDKRVYKQPVFARTPDAPEIFLTSEWLAAIAHGADYAPEFRKQIAGVYELLYGAKLTDDQVKAILESESNAPADKYVDLFG
ncbi:MAG: ABC transporter substrate-binding protein [Shinella sp.]|uniref:ABC transporter substrate-binding protein n=1 Tax=Shinella sp. TaxID=1870904 RepID=UPI00403579C1